MDMFQQALGEKQGKSQPSHQSITWQNKYVQTHIHAYYKQL